MKIILFFSEGIALRETHYVGAKEFHKHTSPVASCSWLTNEVI